MSSNQPTFESRYVVIFRELERLQADAEVSSSEIKEMEEIEELRKIVTEVETERPRFLAST